MANRHSNKRLRGAVRARMASTGESYQAARARLVAARSANRWRGIACATPSGRFVVDLIEARLFGQPAVIAMLALDHIGTSLLCVTLDAGARGRALPPRSPLMHLHAPPRS